MKEKTMSPGEFATFLEVDIKVYSNWENDRSRPNLEKALIIAEKLNKSVNDIWYLEK